MNPRPIDVMIGPCNFTVIYAPSFETRKVDVHTNVANFQNLLHWANVLSVAVVQVSKRQ